MNFLQTFLMWFPPCALFVALAWVTEFAWRAQDGDGRRRVLRQEDGTPLMWLD